ncbi:VTT domain-containing protein [Thioalkalivibrio sp.]|uniref:TVP38/TMEM64 family protein n=1 Tax=Thioalkalivibrio sp. TaxID=2093813 RepID=UPI0012D558F4|nr:VTT domain-containing protein [Thioalkalivibrio sp.]TVP81741.1 MAG: rhodanese [Thioalkalivibrio sp.]
MKRLANWLHRHWGVLLLLTLVAVGLVLATWHARDLTVLLEKGEQIADRPAAMVAVVVLMIVLFAFALPGSLGLWLIAPFHPPVVSVAMLLVGSVLGALGAHTVSHRLGKRWSPGASAERLVEFLSHRSDLLTQSALRVLPGFPHSFVNYAGGVLGLPRGTFLLAALLGLTVKWGVYATAVHGAVEAIETGDALQPQTVLPLFVLAALLLLGGLVRKRIERRRDSD